MAKFNFDRLKNEPKRENWVKVGMSTCGIAAGAQEVFDFLTEELKKRKINVPVLPCGCAGKCYAEPLVEVKIGRLPAVIYGGVDQKVATDIIEKHILNQKLIDDCLYGIKEC